ncbi:MAG: helix-turn-helix transcriptional regulator [Dehalococcoidia bacterium]|nr:helix-turn-helix transcriptional regulator [Dehalococcoidia bacterium]
MRRKLCRFVEAALGRDTTRNHAREWDEDDGGGPSAAGSRRAKAGAPSSGKVELPRFEAKVTYQHPSAVGGARAVVTFNSPLDVPAGTFAKALLDELKRAGLALGVRHVDLLNDGEGRQEVVLKLSRLRLVPDSLEHGRLKAGLACYREQGAVVLGGSGEEYRLRGLKALLSPVLAGEVETALGEPDGDLRQADDEFSASLIAAAESWVPGGKRGLAARRALERLRHLDTEHYLEAVLMVLLSWNGQRESWAKQELQLGAARQRVRRHVIAVDPSRFRSWVDPHGKDKDWRQRIWGQLAVLRTVHKTMDKRPVAFLSALVDGQNLERPGYGAADVALAAAIREAGVAAPQLMFVELSPQVRDGLPRFHVDGRSGKVLWSGEAFGGMVRSEDLHGEGIKELRQEIDRRAAFFVIPEHLLAAAVRDGFTTGERALLVAILGEMRDMKDGYFPCFGQTISGYKPTTWAWNKAGYRRKRGGKRLTELAELAAAIERLHDWCGLEAAISTHERDTVSALETLRTYANRTQVPSGRNLRLYLPANFMRRFEGRATTPDPAQVRIAEGEALRARRKALGMNQQQTATLFSRDRSAVSNWERGASQMPAEVIAWVNGESDGGANGRA